MLPPNVNFIVTVRWIKQTIILGSVNIFVAMTKYMRKEKRACLVSVYKLLALLPLSSCVWVRIHFGAFMWGLWESCHEEIHIENLGATQSTLLFLVESIQTCLLQKFNLLCGWQGQFWFKNCQPSQLKKFSTCRRMSLWHIQMTQWVINLWP